MVKFLIKFVGTVVFVSIFSLSSIYAQVPQEKKSSAGMGPRKQLATIIFSGLGGAVLGLSTLSFYGRPQDKLSNIAVGFAIGIIIGTVYTTYKAATKPYYSDDDLDAYSWLNENGESYSVRMGASDTAASIGSLGLDELLGPSSTTNYKAEPEYSVNAIGYAWSF